MSLENTLLEIKKLAKETTHSIEEHSEMYLSAVNEHPCNYCRDSKILGRVRLFFGGYVDCPKCDATGIERETQQSLPIDRSELQKIADHYRKILATISDNRQKPHRLS